MTPGADPKAPVRARRFTTGPHAEFVNALVYELRGSLASLKGATETLVQRRNVLPDDVAVELAEVADHQAEKLVWLVRLLEAVDGDGTARRVEDVDVPAIVGQAAEIVGADIMMDEAIAANPLEVDPQRLRLGLELLFSALSRGGHVTATMPHDRLLSVSVPSVHLDDRRCQFELRSAWRILESEGCRLRFQPAGAGATRVDVRFA